jgi:Protein of unknown function (DUF1761)
MQEISTNWLALVLTVLAKMALGAVWFSPPLFLKPWLAAAGVSEAEMKERMPKALAVDLVGAVIMAFVLVHAVKYAGAQGVAQGAAVGFLNWLGFIAVATLSGTIHEHRPFKLWLIGNGYQLVSLIVMGAILAAWP